MPVRTVENPPNPWRSTTMEWLVPPPPAMPEVFEEDAKSILAENSSPDVSFRWSVNPYRGCHHGCIYCYARPSHQYLDFGAGSDFERKIVVKRNAPALLEQAFLKRSWTGEPITFSGNTDCYQPLEASYGLTRQLLEICARFRNPVGIITKGALIRRDLDVLTELQAHARVIVYVLIPFSDTKMARRIEPWAPSPERRFETIAALTAAGISVGVSLAPLIPGLNEAQMPTILERARTAGATRAFYTLIRLSGELQQIFPEGLRRVYPHRTDKVLNAIRQMKGGRLNITHWGDRMRGRGPRWQAIEDLWKLHCRRLGFNVGAGAFTDDQGTTFRRPGEAVQLTLNV